MQNAVRPMQGCVIVEGLRPRTGPKLVGQHFAKFGVVDDLRMPVVVVGGKSKRSGVAYVIFADHASVQKATSMYA